jgi:hypothetical protein
MQSCFTARNEPVFDHRSTSVALHEKITTIALKVTELLNMPHCLVSMWPVIVAAIDAGIFGTGKCLLNGRDGL